MAGQLTGFIMWCLVGCMFIVFGVYSAFSKTPTGFWANVKTFEVTDVKKYNLAVAKLFCTFGAAVVILGVPLLSPQDSPWILLSVVGIMAAAIVLMAVYVLMIEKKYKKTK